MPGRIVGRLEAHDGVREFGALHGGGVLMACPLARMDLERAFEPRGRGCEDIEGNRLEQVASDSACWCRRSPGRGVPGEPVHDEQPELSHDLA